MREEWVLGSIQYSVYAHLTGSKDFFGDLFCYIFFRQYSKSAGSDGEGYLCDLFCNIVFQTIQ